MIRSLTIEGYRGFEHFEMRDLGRVNLLVGTNSSGKTSVLEAVLLLASQGDPHALWEILSRRGESPPEERRRGVARPEVEVGHMFTGHRIDVDSAFMIRGGNDSPGEWMSCSISEAAESETLFEDEEYFGPSLALSMRSGASAEEVLLHLSRKGVLASDAIRRHRAVRGDEGLGFRFVSSESLSSEDVGVLWQATALTPEEELVVQALQTLEPRLQRIAFVGSGRYVRPQSRGGFVVKYAGSDQPVPIGSMGDGIWRMLALALAGIRSQGGVLLVDEIDTGLHYTVMEDMWKLISVTAERFNVQVFATTHSTDCVRSLASICGAHRAAGSDVSIQRIEPEKGRAVAFSEREIAVAAERNIEVR